MKKDSDFKSQIKPLFRVFANTNSFYMLIHLRALHNINQFTYTSHSTQDRTTYSNQYE